MKKCFETVGDIYEEIEENFDEIQIQANGLISFQFNFGRRKKVPIQFRATLVEELSKEQSFFVIKGLNSKIEKLETETNGRIKDLELTVTSQN